MGGDIFVDEFRSDSDDLQYEILWFVTRRRESELDESRKRLLKQRIEYYEEND